MDEKLAGLPLARAGQQETAFWGGKRRSHPLGSEKDSLGSFPVGSDATLQEAAGKAGQEAILPSVAETPWETSPWGVSNTSRTVILTGSKKKQIH